MRSVAGILNWAARILGHHPGDGSYVRYLKEVAADSSIGTLRSQSLALLQLSPGHHVVDLGCGPGTLTVQLGGIVSDSGRVVGVDRDPQMVRAADQLAAEAHLSGRVTHMVDDCRALSFGNEVFDACYCERVFQHLSARGPALAAAEMLRILRPGGRFVLVDSDWSTLVINTDRADLQRRVIAASSKAFPNPTAGRRLRQYVTTAGAAVVQETASIFDIGAAGATATLLTGIAEKTLSAKEFTAWLASLERARQSHLPYGRLTMTVVVGSKACGAAKVTA